MAEQTLPILNPNIDVADTIESTALEVTVAESSAMEAILQRQKISEQGFEDEGSAVQKKKEAQLESGGITDEEIHKLDVKHARWEKFYELRKEQAAKQFEIEVGAQKRIDATDDKSIKKQIARRRDMQLADAETAAAKEKFTLHQEKIEAKFAAATRIFTDPISVLKDAALKATIATGVWVLRKKRERFAQKEKLKNIDEQNGVMSDGGVMGGAEASAIPSETESYYGKMLGFMGRLTTSTEDSTSEQISQNKRDSRTSAAEESSMEGIVGGDGPLTPGGPLPDKKKKKPGMMDKLKDMDPMGGVGKLFGSLFKGLGKIGGMILNIGSKFLIPLVTNPIGWAVILGGIAIGLLWTFKDKIAEAVGSIWESIKSGIDSIVSFIKGMFGKAWDVVKGLLNKIPGGSFIISAVDSLFGGGDEKTGVDSDLNDEELANKRHGDQNQKQRSRRDVYRKMDEKNSNPHSDEPWGEFWKPARKPGDPRSEKIAISKAKMKFRASQLEGSGQTSGVSVGGKMQQGRQAQNGAMENYALSSVAHKETGAQTPGNQMLNAPTTNITNNTIEDRSFNTDPTIAALGSSGVWSDDF
jgi:hypothetical protein